MKLRYLSKFKFLALLIALVALQLSPGPATANPGGVEASYHGELGLGSHLGMLEKWCALPNFSFEQENGIDGWSSKSCNACHIGASWNPTKPFADCTYCHASADPVAGDSPTISKCMTCHKKDTSKRGVLFTAEEDVHIAAGMLCQTCHVKATDELSDHQFLKGTAMDTTEETMEGTLSCTVAGCHDAQPHQVNSADSNSKSGKGRNGETLNLHTAKVACETCHTGLRPAAALASRKWNMFTDSGSPVTTKRAAGWQPLYKWYDNTGPGASGDFHLPILSHTERRDVEGAKIYPFNAVTVDWFVKTEGSSYDDVIIAKVVKAADSDGDNYISVEEMRAAPAYPGFEAYPEATLMQADMNFSISHSVVPVDLAFECKDCHGRNGWVLNWEQLGYDKDPRKKAPDKADKGKGKNKD